MTTTEQGKVVGELPPRGSTNTEWDSAVATAQKHPGKAVEVADDVRAVKINSIRQYTRRAPYSTPDGHIEVSMRNSHVDDDGIRRGTMYFTWIANKKGKK